MSPLPKAKESDADAHMQRATQLVQQAKEAEADATNKVKMAEAQVRASKGPGEG